jgi:RHS repeat-associated protein
MFSRLHRTTRSGDPTPKRFQSALCQLGALALALGVLAFVQLPLAGDSIAEATPPPPPTELTQFRTASSRTFDNNDGTFTTAAYSGRIHYRDDQGAFRPISSALIPSQEPGYAFENEANSFRAFFKSQLGTHYLQLATGSGSGSFMLSLENAAQSSAQTRQRGLSYPDVFPGVELRYDLQPDGVKESLLLANAQVPLSYHFVLSPPEGAHVHAVERGDGSWAFFMAPHARPVFILEAPWAAESGILFPSIHHASLDVSRSGGDFQIDLGLDPDWLLDPLRQFPVRVDPSITIQPPFQDASFDFNCSGCTGTTSDRLSIGTGTGVAWQKWRSALQFSLADIPAGASISSAKLKLYFDGTCITVTGPTCGGTSHQINAYRMTNSWSPSSKVSQLSFDSANSLASFTLPSGAGAQWMSWDITGQVLTWYGGQQPNLGLLLKRLTETTGLSGPRPPSRNYAPEPTLGPKLEVTYNGDGGELLEPETVHADGAELRWIPYGGPGAPPFSSYEVHRSASSNFTPSESTKLTKILDAGLTSYRDTTAKAGATFTYKVVVNGYETNARTVTMPADGQARKLLRPDSKAGLDTYVTQRSDLVECVNRGALDRLKVGTDAVSIWRSLLSFDFSDIAPTATLTDATLSLWHPNTTTASLTVRAHRSTANWQEGSGSSSCTGDGATWYETTGGVRWAQDGGDFDPAVAASLTIPSGSQAGWSQWPLTSLAQQWVNGGAANMGVLLKLDDETRVAGKSVDFYSSDFAVAPTLRPKLSVTYADGSHSVAPTVSVTRPSPGVQVNGNAVQVNADAFDDRRVEIVEFFADGNSIGTDASAPYSVNWNSTTAANGSHSLTARATDDAGNQTTSAALSVTVGNSATPTTSITSPTGGSVTGTVIVNANASDDLAVTKVEFYADGVPFATDTSGPYSASWNTLDPALPAYDGVHTLTTKAYDAHAQVTTSAPVNVTAVNAAGTLFLADFSSSTIPPYVEYRPEGQSEPTYPVDVTVTNRSTTTWSATNIVLRYRWYVLGSTTSIVDSGNVPLGTAVLPGGQVTRQVVVTAPTLPVGVARASYELRIDLYDLASSSWFAPHGNKPLEQAVPAEQLNPALPGRPIEPLSAAEKLGIEPNFQYDRDQLGLGMENLVNVATGNSVVRWVPLQSPGRGLSTVVQLTYNSLEGRCEAISCPAGNGWSLGISSLTRFGKQAFKVQGNRADLADADGTLHIFDKHGQQWDPRPGTHWYLREDTNSSTRRWLVTTPNRVTYFYDCGGNPTFARDKNGNELTFVLDDPYSCSESKQVLEVKDAAQRSFTLAYYAGGIHNKRLKSITDHTGHMLEFFYDPQGGDHGNLIQIVEHGVLDSSTCASDVNRCFNFTYEPDGSQRNRQLLTVVDPLSHTTSFDYVATGTQEDKLWKRTDRMTALTTFAYTTQSDPGTNTTTVTAPPTSDPRITVYNDLHNADRTQGDQDEGLIDSIVDPAGRTTSVTWTSTTQTPPQPLRHVWKVTEPGSRMTEFAYNTRGLVTDRYDPMRHHTQLVYLNVSGDGGFTSDVTDFYDARNPARHWSFIYDANQINLVKVIDPGHTELDPYQSIDYYTGAPGFPGAVFHATDANGHTTTFTAYDENGLATRVLDAKSQETKYAFDQSGLLRSIQDPRHPGDPMWINDRWFKTVFDYDAYQRLVRRSEPKSTDFEFGRVMYSNVRYDLNDNVVAFHQPDYGDKGDETTLTYDAMDRRTQAQNPQGERTAFAYDTAGRPTQVTRPKGLLNPPPPPPPIDPTKDYSTEYRYDRLDRVVTKIQYEADGAANRRTHYCYNNVGDLRWVTAPRAGLSNAPTVCETDANVPSFTTRYTYDEDHRARSVTEPVDPPLTPTRTRTFDYDENDNLIDFGDELGTHTTYQYTDRNEVETKIETFVKSPLRELRTRFVYDRVGNLICAVSPRAWDTGSRCTDQNNPGDYVTQYRYNELNQLERIALPDDTAPTPPRTYIHRRYDANGNLTLTTLPVSNAELGTLCQSPSPLCTEVKYFDPGWIFSSNDHVNANVFFNYEAEGWQTRRQACDDGCQTAVQNHYTDGLLASVKRHSSRRNREGDGTATYTYDVNNNLTSALARWVIRSTEKSSVLGADYNGYDEPTRVRETPDGGSERVTDYTYDASGNVATRLDNATPQGTNGRRHEFTYDEADQLKEDYDWVDQTKGNVGDQRTVSKYKLTGWDDEKTTKKLESTGPEVWKIVVQTNRFYFDNGDLQTLSTKNREGPGQQEVERHELTYLAGNVYLNGNRVQDTFTLKNSGNTCWTVNCTTTYTYGPRDEVTNEQNPWGTSRSWTYNDQLNMSTDTVGAAVRTFTYDGNRLRTVDAPGSSEDARYLYDPDGNLDCVVDIGFAGSSCPAASGQASTIDPALKVDYTWDFLNRLQRYRTFSNGNPSDHADYEYDALNRLLKETATEAGQTRRTCFTYLGLSQAISDERRVGNAQDCNATPTVTKSYGFDANLERTSMTVTGTPQDNGDYFFARNVHGDPSLLLKSDGGRTGSYSYSAYGGPNAQLTNESVTYEPTLPFNAYRFNDRRLDSASGSEDMGARRYSTGIGGGRFLQSDGYEDGGSDLALSLDPLNMNRYAYGPGNPLSFAETDGHLLAEVGGRRPRRHEAKDDDDRSWVDRGVDYARGVGYGATDTGKGVWGVTKWSVSRNPMTNPGGFLGHWKSDAAVGLYMAKHPRKTASATWKSFSSSYTRGSGEETAGRATFDALTLLLSAPIKAGEKGSQVARVAGEVGSGARAAKGGAEVSSHPPNRIYSAQELLRRVEEPGPFHNFPESFNDDIFERGTRTVVPNFFNQARPGLSNDSIQYRLGGEINGRRGTYEIFTRPSRSGRTEVITHRFFHPDP